MTVVDIIEFLLMALEVTGKFKGKNFHLQKKDESFTWRSSYSWSYVYFLQCTEKNPRSDLDLELGFVNIDNA